MVPVGSMRSDAFIGQRYVLNLYELFLYTECLQSNQIGRREYDILIFINL